MERTLRLQEVQRLFDFMEKKRVRYYDIQVELVDHLASSIEERWKKEPGLSFEEALRLEYRKFGIYGFSKVVGKRQRKMAWLSLKEVNASTLKWVNSPKVFGVVLFIVLFAQVLNSVSNSLEILAGLFGFCNCIFLHALIKQWSFHKRSKQKMLFLETHLSIVTCIQIFLFDFYFMIELFDLKLENLSFIWAQIIAIFSAYLIILTYEMTYIEFPKRRERAEQIIAINSTALN